MIQCKIILDKSLPYYQEGSSFCYLWLHRTSNTKSSV